jgi:hypothetical protein
MLCSKEGRMSKRERERALVDQRVGGWLTLLLEVQRTPVTATLETWLDSTGKIFEKSSSVESWMVVGSYSFHHHHLLKKSDTSIILFNYLLKKLSLVEGRKSRLKLYLKKIL